MSSLRGHVRDVEGSMNAGRLLKEVAVFIVGMALMLAFSVAPASSGEPPKEPILRIETGMHTAQITRIGVDREERYLVTGSNDKTVRVWDLETGRLLRTLRPPEGEGNEGMIYAVAISPDGRTIACAGWTGWDWEETHSIYLFDRGTGSLKKRLSGLPQVIYHLAYSKDGRFLAATLGGKNGIRVYETEGYGLTFTDSDYGDDSCGADFDSKGRLAVSSYDSHIRLYEKDFRLIAKKKLQEGSQPHGVSFSPDGSKIAVAFNDSTKLDILSSKDLSYLFSPDTSAVDNGTLVNVAWSSDGAYLYAGGRFQKDGCPIVKWADGGKGNSTFLKGADNTIMHIIPLRKGGLVFGAADPALGRIDKADKQVFFQGPAIADLRGNLAGFLVSQDAKTVRFGYEYGGKIPAQFSFDKRVIELIDPQGITTKSLDMSPPITKAEGIKITDWQNSLAPKLNGEPLALDQYEISRSLALAPDRTSFLLGADWYLRLFDTKGKEIWRIPVPGPAAWGVNISGDGKKALAAFGDGTIRWYRMSDGKELLALFPHKDRRRWVIWTPSGYYDASAGGEDLIGWHINNGRDQAGDFFPISRFRQQFYRPDVVAKVLETLDEKKAVKLADTEAGRQTRETAVVSVLPPVVTILSPQEGAAIATQEVTVKYLVRSPSGDRIESIEARVNGNPAKTEAGLNLPAAESTRTVRLSLREKDNTIAVIAENRHGESAPAFVRVRWTGKTEEEGIDTRKKLYVLAVGVSSYAQPSLKEGVQYASKDAEDFIKAIRKQKDVLYKDVEVKKLLNEQAATKDDILRGLAWIKKKSTYNDMAVIFLAGHGTNDLNGRYYFLPAKGETGDDEGLFVTGVRNSDIIKTIKYMQGIVLLFIDTCHSGSIMGTARGTTDINGFINELANAGKEGVVFASSTGAQLSLQVEGNGAFTKALVEGLTGAAVLRGTNKITVSSLGVYVAERVKELTKGMQTPPRPKPLSKGDDEGRDFPIAVKLQ
jgi:WD40 repeat protein